ncbi:MAG: Glu/Leu/Phe/Val dehydrogenase [Gemmatimonadetes bacterium]|nr:Glu/Leu/Phe/Val dehydrogenase [Gemmatimonadota bacterium]MCA9767391.1 Glu/Leu/Phe/Val dehydrogenase [Gemmatimonadota bacterium]HPF61899.1 Glu/Leu/Phe/Val dehydrogenase dimerization domain-containing protein [Gemmatimonadales bacterium]HRX18606.1 Glu/Leu/Phe/Val dehydrogenase dimerization domain-containing protein [Gemmatimonadales bacterium]
MDTFKEMQTRGHEQVVFCYEPSCGYFGIIAIHDTTLGPALGGTRVWPYESTEAALDDALRLSRGMTYKSAVAGLNLGGGKAVIVADPKRADRESLFRAHGRFVESLGGRYITAEDVGTSPQDMEFVKRETKHVAGLLNLSGDPSPVTGYGVYVGIKASAKQKWGKDSLAGKTVAVQGAGKVAYYLMSHLHAEGARLIVTDIDEAKVAACVEEFGATAVAPDAIYDQDADIFAPCALGGILNDDTIARLKAPVIAGGANNQLQESRHGRELEAKGFLYAPDYVINGGGVINVYGELQGWTMDRGKRKAQEIYDTLLRVFSIAERDGIPSFEAADRLAEERIKSVAALKDMWVAGDR